MAAPRIELNLPDLPEVPIRLGAEDDVRTPDGRRPLRPPWPVRLRDALTSYLPLMLMALLALGTWWLVKNSPRPLAPAASQPARLEPDYTLRGFTLQRFLPGGELQLTLVGRQLHHYPIDDRIEIEALELTVEKRAGPATRATARRALSNGKATEVQLLGGARVRGTLADGQPIEIDSEFLHYFSLSQRVVTDKPVEVRVGASVVRAGGLVWDNEARVLQMSPPVRAVLQTGRSARP